MAKQFDVEDSLAVIRGLQDQNTPDRTLAILAVSYIDRYLEMVLAARLPGLNSDLRTKLFGGYGPLATTAAKIDVGTAMGILQTADRANILLLNRVRNRFAHEIHVDAFAHPTIKELCDKLKIDPQLHTLAGMFGEKDNPDWVQFPRSRFVMAALNYCVVFNNWMAAYHHKGVLPPSPQPGQGT